VLWHGLLFCVARVRSHRGRRASDRRQQASLTEAERPSHLRCSVGPGVPRNRPGSPSPEPFPNLSARRTAPVESVGQIASKTLCISTFYLQL